jgi:hypothetical protein
MDPSEISPSSVHYALIQNLEQPNIINSRKLKLQSKIQWDNLLKRKKTKRKTKSNKIETATIINRAMQNVKNMSKV